MPEKDTIFESKVKYTGIFDFAEFYKFCYSWLVDETGMSIFSEDKYIEKVSGDSKDLDIEWSGKRKFSDYFRFDISVKFKILKMKKVEIVQNGVKIKTNDGVVEMKVKGVLTRDYDGKFESTGFQKFLRSIYEKWVITGRIDQFEDKIVGDCDDFINQAKAWLDLEGKTQSKTLT
jgi:hypothetical protein